MPRIGDVLSASDLQALVVHGEGDVVLVGTPQSFSIWRFDPTSLGVHNGSSIIKPTNLSVKQRGRWYLSYQILGAGSVTELNLSAASGVMRDPGRKHMNVLQLPTAVVDGETLVIGTETYEFDDDDDVTEGNIPVPVEGTLIDQVNAIRDAMAEFSQQGLFGIVISQDELIVTFTEDVVPGSELACSHTMEGADNQFAAEAMFGGAAPAVKRMTAIARVPTAVEVDLGRMHFLMEFTPSVVLVTVQATASGIINPAWKGEVSIGTGKVMVTNIPDLSGDFDVTDTVYILAIE